MNEPSLSLFDLTPAHRALQARAREVAAMLAPRAAETDRTEAYPWYAVEALREAGFIGLTIPRQYGGGGGSYLDTTLVVEQLAMVCAASGRIGVETNMGAIGAIMRWGSEAQRRLAADLVLSGDKPAICITEPGAGSDATAMTTRAVRHGDRYIINGRKHWITGGGVSRLHLIFARVIDDGVDVGIGGFIAVLGEDGPGLVVGPREPAMGIRGIPEAEIRFEDLDLPASRRLVPPGPPARGFGSLMQAYNAQRVGAATVALGIAQGAHALAVEYAKTREQFGRPIAEFQGLQWLLADMHIGLSAAQLMIYRAAASASTSPTATDREAFPDPILAAQAKVLAAETALKVTNDALQIHGSAGYSRRNPLERMVRDARMFTISGGTTQVLRNLIAGDILGQRISQRRG